MHARHCDCVLLEVVVWIAHILILEPVVVHRSGAPVISTRLARILVSLAEGLLVWLLLLHGLTHHLILSEWIVVSCPHGVIVRCLLVQKAIVKLRSLAICGSAQLGVIGPTRHLV